MNDARLDDPALKSFTRQPPSRVISLVPSLTESLFELDLGEFVRGITDYCTRPEGRLADLPRVGGPANARLEDILALSPDLVIAGREENPRSLVEALQSAGVPVWVAYPYTIRRTMHMLWQMAQLFKSEAAIRHLIPLETSLEWTQASAEDGATWTYFCPIWTEVIASGTRLWMTFNRETYAADLLRHMGGINVLAGRDRRYPVEAEAGEAAAEESGERSTCYPRVNAAELAALRPDRIILPDEPYSFDSSEENQLLELMCAAPAVQTGRVLRVDGSLITWYGTRLAHALVDLPPALDL